MHFGRQNPNTRPCTWTYSSAPDQANAWLRWQFAHARGARTSAESTCRAGCCAACCAAQPRTNATQEPRACACCRSPSVSVVSPVATPVRIRSTAALMTACCGTAAQHDPRARQSSHSTVTGTHARQVCASPADSALKRKRRAARMTHSEHGLKAIWPMQVAVIPHQSAHIRTDMSKNRDALGVHGTAYTAAGVDRTTSS